MRLPSRVSLQVGRFAVAATRTLSDLAKAEATEAKGEAKGELVEVIADTGMLGVELDLHISQMTLRSKHLQALESAVANHPDVRQVLLHFRRPHCLCLQNPNPLTPNP